MMHVRVSSILSGFTASGLTFPRLVCASLPWSVTNNCRLRSGSPSVRERLRSDRHNQGRKQQTLGPLVS